MSVEFHQCEVCKALVSGAHACSPFALGRVAFAPPKFSSRPLTEDDVRRIVREELSRAQTGER